ncbi:cytosolic protein [Neobacillus sp. DY30]|uniref:cytosolic protein n=1 Tax=Neobacillus sp. DY30 TaxID=3047871 RepID=UPI0024BF57AB|nr:cytosolic protein [Neobacillus sp. DY30]WHX99841.1 cytosolic protein [Neobacillus sp. DY30]
MPEKKSRSYFDLSNVEKRENFLTAEEFPDGPFGSPIRKDKPVQNKSTPWHEGQRYYSNFNYENKTFHQDIPRQMEGAHPVHDDPNQEEQPPYTH